MATISASDLAWVKRRLGDFAASFTDAELQSYYDDAVLDNSDAAKEGTVYYALEALSTGAVAYVDFKAGSTSESASVIYDRISRMAQQYAARAGVNMKSVTTGSVNLNFIQSDDDA